MKEVEKMSDQDEVRDSFIFMQEPSTQEDDPIEKAFIEVQRDIHIPLQNQERQLR